MTGTEWMLCGMIFILLAVCLVLGCETAIFLNRRKQKTRKEGGDTDEMSELPL